MGNRSRYVPAHLRHPRRSMVAVRVLAAAVLLSAMALPVLTIVTAGR